MIGFSLVTLILRYRTARRQLTNARDIECGALGVGFGTAQRRNRLLDDRALSLELAGEVAKCRAPRGNSGCGLVDARTLIAVVDGDAPAEAPS